MGHYEDEPTDDEEAFDEEDDGEFDEFLDELTVKGTILER